MLKIIKAYINHEFYLAHFFSKYYALYIPRDSKTWPIGERKRGRGAMVHTHIVQYSTDHFDNVGIIKGLVATPFLT